jgi:hypothetical protein
MSLHLNHYVKERKRPTPLPTPFSRGDLCAWFLMTAAAPRVERRCGERAFMGLGPNRQPTESKKVTGSRQFYRAPVYRVPVRARAAGEDCP